MKKLVGETEEYVIELEFSTKRHFSVCGVEYGGKDSLLTEEQGEMQARDYLEDGELWKMAVEADGTTRGLKEFIDEVLGIDGWKHVLGDIEEVMIYDRKTEKIAGFRYTPWGGCGQIDIHLSPDDFIKTFIPKADLEKIFEYWSEYHLKNLGDVPPEVVEKMTQIFTPETTLDDWKVYLDEI